MKTAYELAMERLNKTSPTAKLTKAQKKDLAELDSKYSAKIAAREIHLKEQITKAMEAGDPLAVETLEQQLTQERAELNQELEDKKDQIRKGSQ